MTGSEALSEDLVRDTMGFFVPARIASFRSKDLVAGD